MNFTLGLLVLLITLLYTFQSLFTRLFSIYYAGPDEKVSTSVFAICYGGAIGLFTLIGGGFSYQPTWQTLLYGIINAFMLWLYNMAMIQAGNRGSYAFMMISLLYGGLLVPMIVELIFMGEKLTLIQGLAILMMLASFVVMNIKGLSLKGASGKYYLWCLLLFLANGGFTTVMNLQEAAMGPTQSNEMVITSYLGSMLIVLIISLLRGQTKQLFHGFRMGKKAALFALGSCVVATLAANLLLYLLGFMSASVLYTLDNGGVLVLSAVFSCLLFKEKLSLNQIIGIVMATVSIVMISL